MIKVSNLSKSYRVGRGFSRKPAVSNLSFEVETGKVTGFLGPNGAGKSTTMRLMLGLDRGKGNTTYDGKKLRAYSQPSQVVGMLLEAKAFHPTRTARNHLKVLADEGGISHWRVDEVLELVGLSKVAKKSPGKFSLGMSQRLGIAAAILGKPRYLLLDEPANGLDPEGIAWLRQFIRDYAKQGNGVLISSHLLSEMGQMADNVVVIGRGKLIASTSVKNLLTQSTGNSVFVRASSSAALEKSLRASKLAFTKTDGGYAVTGSSLEGVGKMAHDHGLTLVELSRHNPSLEDAFLELTEGTEEFKADKESKK